MKKDIYICCSYYHVLVSLIRTILSKKKNDIIIDSSIPNAQNIILKLESSGLFENVIFFNRNNVKEFNSKNRFLKLFFEHWYNKTVFQNAYNIPFEKYENIYIFNDRTIIGRYIYDLKLKYILLEDGTNYFTDLRRVNYREHIIKDVKYMLDPNVTFKKKVLRKLNYDYVSLGQSKYCKEIIVTDKSNIFIPDSDKIKELSYKKLISYLTPEEKDKIFSLLFCDNMRKFQSISKPKILILTTPLQKEAFVKTKAEQIMVYKTIANKYQKIGYQVYIKPHPRDDIIYSDYISEIILLNPYYPIELIDLRDDIKFDMLVTICSSGSYNISSISKMEILGFDYISNLKSQKESEESIDSEVNSYLIPPAFEEAVSVVLATSNGYIKYLSVLLQSLIENQNQEFNYDIIIFGSDISENSKRKILSQVNKYDNISLRFFCDVGMILEKYSLHTFEYISKETWYRFLIPYVIQGYDVSIYLDIDMVLMDDISKLNMRLDSNTMIAAVRCSTSVGSYHNKNDFSKKEYIDTILKLKNPDDYTQNGTIIFNNSYFRKHFKLSDILKICTQRNWQLADQDAINKLAEGHKKILDQTWNVLCLVSGREKAIEWLPDIYYKEYYEARKNPKIIHYAGATKPWKNPNMDFSECFWKYAKNTPYYENLILDLINIKLKEKGDTNKKKSIQNFKDKKGKILNKILPKSTVRRELVKKIYHFFVPIKGKIEIH